MLRLLTGSRVAVAMVVMATVALAACSSSSSSGSSSPASSASSSGSSNALPVFNPSSAQLAATINRLFLGPVAISSLPQVLQYATKMEAMPPTAAETAWTKSCLSEQICQTGHGTLILAMPVSLYRTPQHGSPKAKTSGRSRISRRSRR